MAVERDLVAATASTVAACLENVVIGCAKSRPDDGQRDGVGSAVQLVVLCPFSGVYNARRQLDEIGARIFGCGRLRTAVVCGASPLERNREMLQTRRPHALVGTPSRVLALLGNGCCHQGGLMRSCSIFIDDEALRVDKDVKRILAKLRAGAGGIDLQCQRPRLRIEEEDERVAPEEAEEETVSAKIPSLCSLLDSVDFDGQAVIFASSSLRASVCADELTRASFPALATCSPYDRQGYLSCIRRLQNFEKRILVTTDDLFAVVAAPLAQAQIGMLVHFDSPATRHDRERRASLLPSISCGVIVDLPELVAASSMWPADGVDAVGGAGVLSAAFPSCKMASVPLCSILSR